MKLSAIVLRDAMNDYKAKVDENGKLRRNLANSGIKAGGRAIRIKEGDYYRFAVEAQEAIRPLLTEQRVSRALVAIENDSEKDAIAILHLIDNVREHGLGVLYRVLSRWLEKNKIAIPQEFSDRAGVLPEELKAWVLATRHNPIMVPIKIVGLGMAKSGNSVVPKDWNDRIFASAAELHKAVDNLPSHNGRPLTTYLATHSMAVDEGTNWENANSELTQFAPALGVTIELLNNHLKTSVEQFSDEKDIAPFVKRNSHLNFLRLAGANRTRILIACSKDGIQDLNPVYHRGDSVGVLASRLQKAIRRGRRSSGLLKGTVEALACAPAYNLPDLQFQRTSGSRQLVWRLFISTVEDAQGYLEDSTGEYLDLLDLACLALLCHHVPELKLSGGLLDKILYTALLIQRMDEPGMNWQWRSTKDSEPVFGDTRLEKALALPISIMPMMMNDHAMLKKAQTLCRKESSRYKVLPKVAIGALLADNSDEFCKEVKTTSYDFHCVPSILISLQAAMPVIPNDEAVHDTRALSKFIWKNSSRENSRNPDHKTPVAGEAFTIFKCLRSIQRSLNEPPTYSARVQKSQSKVVPRTLISDRDARIAFQILFGQSTSLKGPQGTFQITLAGSPKQPCHVRRKRTVEKGTYRNEFLEGRERYEYEQLFIKHLNSENLSIEVPSPPPGYGWSFDGKSVRLNARIVASDPENNTNDLVFLVNDIKVTPFDGRALLRAAAIAAPDPIPAEFLGHIQKALYIEANTGLDDWETNLWLRDVGNQRLAASDFAIYDWAPLAAASKIEPSLWRRLLVRFYNSFDNQIEIGPVNREGDHQYNAIDYLYEGVFYRIFNLLTFLYPEAMVVSGKLRYKCFRSNSSYVHLIQTLEGLAFQNDTQTAVSVVASPKIRSQLWDHQKTTRTTMVNALTKLGQLGIGDASDVGSGKTLTTLSVMADLHAYQRRQPAPHGIGFLVLVKMDSLYDTWSEEIKKHTDGFAIVLQNANGTLTDTIQHNSIVLTTVDRNRDHPLSHSWTFIAIDECTTVVNSKALRSLAAWRQVLSSKYGVGMLSATFFASRFEQLFYLLKMLRTGLPETRLYLDTILATSIHCNLPINNFHWTTSVNRLSLLPEQQKKYQELRNSDLPSDHLFSILQKYIHDNFNYPAAFANHLATLRPNQKAVIFAKSIAEADTIARTIDGVSRFKDKDFSARHIVTTVEEGGYGGNWFVGYNAVVMRPIRSDHLHQVKGRLARPGQKDSDLEMHFLLIGETIEEAALLSLEIAGNFYNDHILPLAVYYDIAVGRKTTNWTQG